MSKLTLVLDIEDSEYPSLNFSTKVLGFPLVAMSATDSVTELSEKSELLDEILEAANGAGIDCLDSLITYLENL